MTSTRNSNPAVVPRDAMWGRRWGLLPKVSLRRPWTSRHPHQHLWETGMGWGLHPRHKPGRSVRGRTQPEPPGRLSFCPGVRGQSMALGPQSLVAWQQRGLAWPPCWSLAWPPCWGLVNPPQCSRPLRWRRPPSAACRAWVGGRRAWGGCWGDSCPGTGREGWRAGVPRNSVPPAPGRQKQGKAHTLSCTYICYCGHVWSQG